MGWITAIMPLLLEVVKQIPRIVRVIVRKEPKKKG